MVQLAPYVAVVNSDDGVDAPLPSDAAYAHKLREVTVNAPKLKVLGLANGSTTGFVACFNDEKDLFATEHDLRLSSTARSFEVCEATSTETLKKSKRSLEDAKAVLVINGQLDGPSGKEFEAMIGAEPACDEFSCLRRAAGPHLQAHPEGALGVARHEGPGRHRGLLLLRCGYRGVGLDTLVYVAGVAGSQQRRRRQVRAG